MLDFRLVSIEDKEIFDTFFLKSTFRNCDFSFANIFAWKHKYHTSFAVDSDFLFIRFYAGGKKAGYMYPLGSGDLKVALDKLFADAEERGEPFRMYAMTDAMHEDIERVYPGKFTFQKGRAWFEYIYAAENLIHLTGKKFQPKRNHINKFKRLYEDYEYLPITAGIIPECLELYNKWCKENGNCMEDQSLVEERIATQAAFDHFEQLGLKGGALRVNGTIVAYSYGQRLTSDTFAVHAEKALYDIDGGFAMINQQFAEHEASGFTYINREEDLGLESLRQAKLSYHPVFLLEKGFATLV